MSELVRYEQACRALADAKAVDEVKGIRDQAEAMRTYARQAKNRTLEIDAAEIRMRAERRLGEMIIAQKETVGLNRGRAGAGRPSLGGADAEQPKTDTRPTLEQAGIDRKLSSRAQKMAAVPEAKFNALIAGWRNEVEAANERVSVDLLRHGSEEEQRQNRRNLAQELSDTSAAMPTGRKYACIYADPAVRRKAGDGNRSYENHYPTMSWDDILALPVKDMLLPDGWVFLWLPRAHVMALHPVVIDVTLPDEGNRTVKARVLMPLGWAIAKAWGCDNYSTLAVWTKTDEEHPDEHGTGLIFYDQDEILLLFKRGQGLPKPDSALKFGSNHRERSKPLGHSRKPDFYRHMIATMTGGLPVLELFARVDAEHPLPKGWDAWGNQSNSPETASEKVGGDPVAAAPLSCGGNRRQDEVEINVSGGAAELPVASPLLSAIAQGPEPYRGVDDGLDIPAFLRRNADNSLPSQDKQAAA